MISSLTTSLLYLHLRHQLEGEGVGNPPLQRTIGDLRTHQWLDWSSWSWSVVEGHTLLHRLKSLPALGWVAQRQAWTSLLANYHRLPGLDQDQVGPGDRSHRSHWRAYLTQALGSPQESLGQPWWPVTNNTCVDATTLTNYGSTSNVVSLFEAIQPTIGRFEGRNTQVLSKL